MGTPQFAVLCLERLIQDGHEIALVVTQPDKPRGRGYKFTPSPIKETALKYDLEVFQPKTLKNNQEAWDKLKEYNADVAVVVAFGQILPPEVLATPKFGCINVHASLLPKYRGAAPIQWSIINGESETGVTTMNMDAGLDTGDMLLKRSVKITDDMTAGELHDILAYEGSLAISETLSLLEQGRLTSEKQDDALSCYAPMLSRDLSPIDWNQPAQAIHNLIRGLNPWPCASTKLGGKQLKILRSSLSGNTDCEPGTVISTSPLTIACGGNTSIEINEVQLEGSKRMASDVFLMGHRIEIGRILPD
jgi:methionyl-tRNA formyltransferase